jgi:hypothetical protein
MPKNQLGAYRMLQLRGEVPETQYFCVLSFSLYLYSLSVMTCDPSMIWVLIRLGNVTIVG